MLPPKPPAPPPLSTLGSDMDIIPIFRDVISDVHVGSVPKQFDGDRCLHS